MRPNRLELCATWEFLPATCNSYPEAKHRQPWALLCYRQRGASWDSGWFAWLWGPQNGKKREKLCWTPHGNKRCWRFPDASNCHIFPKTIQHMYQGISSVRCVAANSVTPQPFPIWRQTVIRAHTIFSFKMASLCYSKTFINEEMPSPFTGRARSCPPTMTFWHWIRPSMASIFPFVESFGGMLRLGLVWCMKIIEKKLRTKAEKPDALNLCCIHSEEMQLKLQASCCRHKRPSQQTVSIYGRHNSTWFRVWCTDVQEPMVGFSNMPNLSKPEIWNNGVFIFIIYSRWSLILRFDRPTPATPSLSGVEVAAEVWVAVQWNTSEFARYLSGESRENPWNIRYHMFFQRCSWHSGAEINCNTVTSGFFFKGKLWPSQDLPKAMYPLRARKMWEGWELWILPSGSRSSVSLQTFGRWKNGRFHWSSPPKSCCSRCSICFHDIKFLSALVCAHLCSFLAVK